MKRRLHEDLTSSDAAGTYSSKAYLPMNPQSRVFRNYNPNVVYVERDKKKLPRRKSRPSRVPNEVAESVDRAILNYLRKHK